MLNSFLFLCIQDGIDLFLGRYTINASLPSPLEVKHTWHYNAVSFKFRLINKITIVLNFLFNSFSSLRY